MLPDDDSRTPDHPSRAVSAEPPGESLARCVVCHRAPGIWIIYGTLWLLCDACAYHVPYGGTLGARLCRDDIGM